MGTVGIMPASSDAAGKLMKSTTTCAGIAENPMKTPFPSLPKYQARWIPVLFTPVTCGEDVLFVGICGEFNNTKFAENLAGRNAQSPFPGKSSSSRIY